MTETPSPEDKNETATTPEPEAPAAASEGTSDPAPAVSVVDSTGAGDAFAAGFIAAHLAGDDDSVALGKGIAAGARAVQSIGGQPG